MTLFVWGGVTVGTNSILAVYGGGAEFAGSKSEVVKQVVEK